jgi:hypothetical protein
MDDRSIAASARGTTSPPATVPVPPEGEANAAGTAEAGGLFAVLEALALAASGGHAAERSTPGVDDRPRPGDNR